MLYIITVIVFLLTTMDMTQQRSSVNQFKAPALGEMTYCEQDQTWSGIYKGYEYRIAAALPARPDKQLLNFCQTLLDRGDYLSHLLHEQKQAVLGNYGGCFDDEILSLEYLNLMFYRRAQNICTLAQLAPNEVDSPDEDERLWRIELVDDKCLGLDFDY